MAGQRDAREHPRFVVDAVVEVASVSRGIVVGRTRNISRGGLCVELDVPFEPGEEVELRVALLFQDRAQTEPLVLPARISWCTPLGDVFQIGSQFRRLSADRSLYLDLFLDHIAASRDVRGGSSHADDDPFAR